MTCSAVPIELVLSIAVCLTLLSSQCSFISRIFIVFAYFTLLQTSCSLSENLNSENRLMEYKKVRQVMDLEHLKTLHRLTPQKKDFKN